MCIFKYISLVDTGIIIGVAAFVCNILESWEDGYSVKKGKQMCYHSNALTEGFQVLLSLFVFLVLSTGQAGLNPLP